LRYGLFRARISAHGYRHGDPATPVAWQRRAVPARRTRPGEFCAQVTASRSRRNDFEYELRSHIRGLTVDVRRQLLIRETIYSEGSLPALVPVTRVAACAIVRNPLAGRLQDDLSDLVPFGEKLGEQLTKEAVAALPGPAVSYGKAAIIGLDGDIEHGAAIIHPKMGRPMREAVGGGKAIIPSNVKVAAAGTTTYVPLPERNKPRLVA